MQNNGIVIVNYNDSNRVIELIEKIRDYQNLKYIVVVDNNSQDGSYKKLKGYQNKKIVVIKAPKNGGYSYGNNIGSKFLVEKKIKNIIISNADIIFEEEALNKLLDYLNDNIHVGVVAPTIIEDGTLSRGWKIPTPMKDVLLNIPKVKQLFGKQLLGYKDECYQDKVINVEATSGCFFIIDSEVLEKINYFDENLFLYYEENILGKKLRELKLKIAVLTDVKVIHDHSKTIDKSLKMINKYQALKESQWYFQVNYNKANIFSKSLLYLTNKVVGKLILVYYKIKK